MRTGLWVSGAGGSGILVGRKPDGTWSAPAGIMLHTAGLGFLVGVDIYDCVLVLNSQQAVDSFARVRCTVGGEISAVAGPVGIGGLLETEVHKRQAPIFTYLKSRGFYAGVQIDGTVVIERTDENERFYLQKMSAVDIVAGKIRHPPYELRTLMETLKAAEGNTKVNHSLLPTEPSPADFEVVEEGHIFGIPDQEDPDPYGVHALEKEGLEIKEAGTQRPVSIDQFEFKPSASSPIYSNLRRSSDTPRSQRSSWRQSTVSSIEKRLTTTDGGTQTDFDAPLVTTRSRSLPLKDSKPAVMEDEKPIRLEDNDPTTRWPDTRSAGSLPVIRPSITDTANDIDDGEDTHEDSFEEPVVHEIQQSQAPQIIKARLVTLPKRVPPTLPARNPGRYRPQGGISANGTESPGADNATHDQGTGMSVPVSPEKELEKEPLASDHSPMDHGTSTSLPLSSDKEQSHKSLESSSSEKDTLDSITSPASSPGRASFSSVKSEPEQGDFTNAVSSAVERTHPSLSIENEDTINDLPGSFAQAGRPLSAPVLPVRGPVGAKISLANIRRSLDVDPDSKRSPDLVKALNTREFTTVQL